MMTWTMDRDMLESKIKKLIRRIENYYQFALPVYNEKHVVYHEEIGRGAEGIVHRCQLPNNKPHPSGTHSSFTGNICDPPDDRICAAKRVLNFDIDSVQRSLDEIYILCIGMKSPNPTTTKIFGICITDNPFLDSGLDCEAPQIVIFTEIGICNLLDFYRNTPHVPITVTLNLWADIAQALRTMHSNNIIHRDLKPDNILLVRINKNIFDVILSVEIRIIDVGMSYHPQIVEFEDTFGTVGYHSPEMLAEEGYNSNSDIFSLGILYMVTLMPLNTGKLKLDSILLKIDRLKKKGILGMQLFEMLNIPKILNSPLIGMLTTMIEKNSRRKIELTEIHKLCMFYVDYFKSQSNIENKENSGTLVKRSTLTTFKKSSMAVKKSQSMSAVTRSPTRIRRVFIKKKSKTPLTALKAEMAIIDLTLPYESFRWRGVLRSPLRNRNRFRDISNIV